MERFLSDADATTQLGRSLAVALRPGDVVLLDGPLGAGKTTLVRAIAEARGVDPALIASPTFTLMHEYQGEVPFLHLDAYRLEPDGLEGLGFDEASETAMALIEWGSRVEAHFADHPACWRITLRHRSDGSRAARIIAPEGRGWAMTIRRPCNDEGQDPLVRSFAAKNHATCAVRCWHWRWFLLAMACAAVGAGGAAVHAGVDGWVRILCGSLVGLLLLIGSEWLFCRRNPRHLPVSQECWAGWLVVAVAYGVLFDPLVTFGLITGGLTVLFALAILVRVLAVVMGGRKPPILGDVPMEKLPRSTVLVPLYREAGMVKPLLESLSRLDYPTERLQILLLLEADDPDTLAAIQAVGLPPWMTAVVVPHAQPKTKPRACNHGLALATGKMLVIFDAEDRPEPDQLRKAAIAFNALPPKVACLQARLAYRNRAQNRITRWFSAEYNAWFGCYLPGLQRLGFPIPLGGTSNHFRTAVLRQLGGWDPFNVTEDCDLGIRLHITGWRTAILDSTTWEEAASQRPVWIRQRSRWMKGYAITHLVWARRPLWLLSKLGLWGSCGFLAVVPAVPLLAALTIPLWSLLFLQATLISIDLSHGHSLMAVLGERDWAHERLSWPLWFSGSGEDPVLGPASKALALATGVLLMSNLGFMLLAAGTGRLPGQPRDLRSAATVPLYWLMMSFAAWRGLWQVFSKPHYWEKTVHGLDH